MLLDTVDTTTRCGILDEVQHRATGLLSPEGKLLEVLAWREWRQEINHNVTHLCHVCLL